jgi:branched-chain amino acid transport system ATP-binding protein
VSLLSIEQLQVAYGGIRAVKGIDLKVEPGELVCLIGANGAGKTTTLRRSPGLVRAAAGAVRYDGTDISRMKPHQIARRGLALVPEGPRRVRAAQHRGKPRHGCVCPQRRRGRRADVERAFTLFPAPEGAPQADRGHALRGRAADARHRPRPHEPPKLLLLDEPSMGLAPLMVEKIFEVIRAIAAEGRDAPAGRAERPPGLEVSHRAYVLEGGLVTLTGEGTRSCTTRDSRGVPRE